MGYTAELALLLDVSTMGGRLSPSFQVNRVSEDVQYEQGSQDFKDSWVQKGARGRARGQDSEAEARGRARGVEDLGAGAPGGTD
jgi:hypothetical protein